MKPRPKFNPLEIRIGKLERKVRTLNFFVGVGIVVSGLFAIGAMLAVLARR